MELRNQGLSGINQVVMKRLLRLQLLLSACLAWLVSCEMVTGEEDGTITINKTNDPSVQITPAGNANLAFSMEGGSVSISFLSTGKWTAAVDAGSEWCSVNPSKGDAGTVTVDISASPSTGGDDRKASVVLRCGTSQRTIKVTQVSPVLEIDLEEDAVYADGDTRTINVNSNVPWTASCDQPWCTLSVDKGAGEGTVNLVFEGNPEPSSREVAVTFTSSLGGLIRKAVFRQSISESLGFDWTQEFRHHSLFFRFTATWCVFCPRMASSIELCRKQYPDQFYAVNIHVTGSKYETPDYVALYRQFGITGVPTGCLDMRRILHNDLETTFTSNFGHCLQEQNMYYPVSSAIAFDSSIKGETLNASMTLFIKEPGNYKVAALVTESNMHSPQTGAGEDYRHDDAVRLLLTSIQGVSFITQSENQVVVRSYSVQIPSDYNKDNLKVLVYVQRAFGSQERHQDENFGNYYVDNAAYAPVGTHVSARSK